MADIARFKELVIGKRVILRNTVLHTFTATYKWKQCAFTSSCDHATIMSCTILEGKMEVDIL